MPHGDKVGAVDEHYPTFQLATMEERVGACVHANDVHRTVLACKNLYISTGLKKGYVFLTKFNPAFQHIFWLLFFAEYIIK